MMEYIDIESLNPAEYNPRLLTPEAQEELKKSITELGIINLLLSAGRTNELWQGTSGQRP